MLNILIIGHKGQLGFECQKSLSICGKLSYLPQKTGRMLQEGSLLPFLNDHKTDVIVNAAAYTQVDKAEMEIEKAKLLNTELPKVLSSYCKQHKISLAHVSTDYVFKGDASKPYLETDICEPQGVYGQTKRDGEKYIEDSGCDYINLRTAWLYGIKGVNFLKKMISLAKEKETLKVVNDQFGSPTFAGFLASAISHILIQSPNGFNEKSGTYHVVNSGVTTWYEFAKRVIDLGSIPTQRVLKEIIPCSSLEYVTPAKRPAYSVLDNSKVSKVFGLNCIDWAEQLQYYFETKDWMIIDE